MTDLIPHHDLKIVQPDDAGWVVFEYRSAVIRSRGIHNQFRMSGHPYDGTWAGNIELLQRFADHWADHRTLPPGYLHPKKQRA